MSPFFDTNILVYAQQADGKGDRARKLFASGGKLSAQVLNEFTAVSRRKQRRDWREIDEAVADVLTTSIRRWRSRSICIFRRERSPKIICCPSPLR